VREVIEKLPGAPLSPEVLLHQLLEKDLKGVVVMEVDHQNNVTVHWSTMEAMIVVYAKEILCQTIAEFLRDPGIYTEQEEESPS
jgi:hypothetical protein